MKPMPPSSADSNPSPSLAAAAAGPVSGGSNQPHLSPLHSSVGKDDFVSFPTKQPTTLCTSGERQVTV